MLSWRIAAFCVLPTIVSAAFAEPPERTETRQLPRRGPYPAIGGRASRADAAVLCTRQDRRHEIGGAAGAHGSARTLLSYRPGRAGPGFANRRLDPPNAAGQKRAGAQLAATAARVNGSAKFNADLLRAMTRESDHSVVHEAVTALGFADDRDSLPAVEACLAHSPRPFVPRLPITRNPSRDKIVPTRLRFCCGMRSPPSVCRRPERCSCWATPRTCREFVHAEGFRHGTTPLVDLLLGLPSRRRRAGRCPYRGIEP